MKTTRITIRGMIDGELRQIRGVEDMIASTGTIQNWGYSLKNKDRAHMMWVIGELIQVASPKWHPLLEAWHGEACVGLSTSWEEVLRRRAELGGVN